MVNLALSANPTGIVSPLPLGILPPQSGDMQHECISHSCTRLSTAGFATERSNLDRALPASATFIRDRETDRVAVLAYSLWQRRGCPKGSAFDDWLEAGRQLSARLSRPDS